MSFKLATSKYVQTCKYGSSDIVHLLNLAVLLSYSRLATAAKKLSRFRFNDRSMQYSS